MLADAHTVLVHVAGGTELTLNEVSVLMEEFNRHISDGTQINFGVITDARYGRKLCVSILSSTGDEVLASQAKPTVPKFTVAEKKEELFEKKETTGTFEADQEPEPFEELEEPEPVKPAAKVAPKPAPAKESAPKKEEKAEQMSLEPVNRGRFDKGEPTIVDGEDLDVPTFLRKNLKVK
jgi:cell division protein FtsZ